MRRSAAIVLLTIGSAACGGNTGPEPLLDALPRALSPAELRIVDAANQFTFGLVREATRGLPPDSNAFLSPLSASFALGMTLNGARAETEQAMRSALGFGGATMAEINQGYRDLIELLTGLDRTTEMRIANSLWGSSAFPMRQEFTDAARTWFDAEVRSLDFRSPAAVGTINDWVKTKTAGRIPKLLDAIRADEVLFLINAIYFKGAWRVQFDRGKTRDAPFTGADGRARQVPMMSLDATPLRYAATSAFQAVDLLYGNGAFAMTVLLPSPGKTPADVLTTLDPASWSALVDQVGEHKVALGLPRFRVEYGARLNAALAALGMGIAFDDQRADLSGIADVAPERLYLTRVDQKAFVEVNEEGTEAAAATAVGVGLTSAPPSVIVDRPFLFLIRERFSGTILFVGLIQQLGA